MDRNKLLSRHYCVMAYVTILVLMFIIRFNPISPVFAFQSNETVTGQPNMVTNGEGMPPNDLGDGTGATTPCDLQDPACGGAPPPCDPQDPNCGVSPCDLQDPLCPDNGGGPLPCNPSACPEEPFSPSIETCNDGIDNEGNVIIDDPSQCDPGGPCITCFPGGAASTGRSSPLGDPNILGAFQTNLLPGSAEATLSSENNCNDGIDNNRNSLKDSQDPGCSFLDLSQTEAKPLAVSNVSKSPTNTTKNLNLLKSQVDASPASSLGNGNIMVISIYGESGQQSHDIRTISLHYKYTQEKITIEKGTKVMWVNNDPIQTHGINLKDRLSGKIVYTYPVIRPGTNTYYIFENPGQYTYSDPKYLAMSGLITVVN